MKKLFNLFALLSLATGFVACENNEQPTPDNSEYTVNLATDKSEIKADGTDTVTFTVKVNGEVKTDEVMIICLEDNSVLEGQTFTTTTPGEYRFKASYKTFTSDSITITAISTETPKPEINVELKADKTEIVADNSDTVTFSVEVNGEDKSSEATIKIVNYNTELEGNSFVSDVAGEFTFVAEYEGTMSNEVKVTATAVEIPQQKTLKLSVSKIRIKADGVDSATFTAMYGEEDVTAACEIRTTAGDVIEGGVFSTTTVGSFNIYALYDNQRSNTVSIDSYDPNATIAYEIGTIHEINGVNGVIYAIKDNYVYMFSMDEADLQWSTENVWCNCNSSKGEWNTYDPFDPQYSRADGGVRDIKNYPAFKWCMDHGEGWFMPSSQELQWMWDAVSGGTHRFDSESVAQYNKLLTDNGGMPFVETYYWSSNETSADLIELIAFMNDSVVCLDPQKTNYYTVRAAYRFPLE